MTNFNASAKRTRPAILRYAAAVLSVVAAVSILLWMEIVFQSAAHVSLFLCAVMFSAWYGGIGPGLLAIALSALGFKYYFLPPIYSLTVEITQLPRLVLVAVSALVVGSLSAAQRSAAESLRRTRDELQQAFQQLQSTHEALQTENIERNRAQELLHEQASLLNLTHDTIFVRDMNDVISYWNRGAEELYGWKKEKAIGQISHQLTQTIFPAPLNKSMRSCSAPAAGKASSRTPRQMEPRW